MSAMGASMRRALLGAAADLDGKLPEETNLRTAIGLEQRGYIEKRPVLPGDTRTIGQCAAWPFPVWITPAGRAEAERLGAAPAPSRVVVIPCGSKKLSSGFRSWPAGELYIGGYHRACRRAADAMVAANGGRVLILSAKWGLVSLERELWPYDMRLGHRDAVTPEKIRRQARAMGVTGAAAVVLAGQEYSTLARTVWPQAETPLAGVGGMGVQKRFLAQLAA